MSPNSNSLPTNTNPLLWYAMSATFGRELKVKAILEQEEVECFVPMRYEIRKYKGRKTVRQLVSAVSNLIFVHTTRDTLKDIKQRIEYLHFLVQHQDGRNSPIIVSEQQMAQFISVCNTHNEKLRYLSPDEIDLSKGTRVRIAGGTFDGVEGTFVRVAPGKHKRVFVMVEGVIGVMLTQITDGYIQVLD